MLNTKLVIVFGLTLASLLLLGCTETSLPSFPFTNSQLINKSTDLNYELFVLGFYDGNCLKIDVNKISIGDCNSGGGNTFYLNPDGNIYYLGLMSADTNSWLIDLNVGQKSIFNSQSLELKTFFDSNSPFVLFDDANISHPFTGIGGVLENVLAETAGIISMNNQEYGGIAISGFTEDINLSSPIVLSGHIDQNAPIMASARVDGWKTDGADGRTTLVGKEPIFALRAGSRTTNGDQFYFYADGTAAFKGGIVDWGTSTDSLDPNNRIGKNSLGSETFNWEDLNLVGTWLRNGNEVCDASGNCPNGNGIDTNLQTWGVFNPDTNCFVDNKDRNTFCIEDASIYAQNGAKVFTAAGNVEVWNGANLNVGAEDNIPNSQLLANGGGYLAEQNISWDNSGNLTAVSFIGDGSSLTNVPAVYAKALRDEDDTYGLTYGYNGTFQTRFLTVSQGDAGAGINGDYDQGYSGTYWSDAHPHYADLSTGSTWFIYWDPAEVKYVLSQEDGVPVASLSTTPYYTSNSFGITAWDDPTTSGYNPVVEPWFWIDYFGNTHIKDLYSSYVNASGLYVTSNIDGDNRLLIDNVAANSLDWQNRIHYASDGSTKLINYTGNYFDNGASISFLNSTQTSNALVLINGITDAFGYHSLGTENRTLYDSTGTYPLLNWSGTSYGLDIDTSDIGAIGINVNSNQNYPSMDITGEGSGYRVILSDSQGQSGVITGSVFDGYFTDGTNSVGVCTYDSGNSRDRFALRIDGNAVFINGGITDNLLTGNSVMSLNPNTRTGINTSGVTTLDWGNNKLFNDWNVSANLSVDGNTSFKIPYGTYTSMKTQTVGSTSIAYYMDFNTTEDSYLITKIGDTNFGVVDGGDYMVNISIVGTSGTAGKKLNVWFRKNGVDIPRSNTPYQFKTNNSIAIISVPFILDLNSTDIFSVMYSADGTDVTLPTYNATVSPPAPETPSSIMTIYKIGESFS